jgi:hypothetical protein
MDGISRYLSFSARLEFIGQAMSAPNIPNTLGQKVTTSTFNWRTYVINAWGEFYRQRDISYDFSVHGGIDKQSTDTTNRGFYSGH